MSRAQVIFAAIGAIAIARSGFSQPARLENTDPLTQPPPALMGALVLPDDGQRPEEKIMPGLWARLARSAEHEEIAVIIELHRPQPRTEVAPYSKEWDAEQATLSAVVEHRFAAKVAGLISGLRGLSHFPIVFGTVTRDNIKQVAVLPDVSKIYEDELVHVSRVEGAALMKASTLRIVNGGSGAGAGVAVLDTGIDDGHPELSSRVVAQLDTTGTTGDGTVDDNGHGTAAAGIIAGTNGGMAPQASLWAIKVAKADGSVESSAVMVALNSLYANRASFGGLDLINMSFGGGGPFNSDCDSISPYNAELVSLYNAGVTMFASSGNSGALNGISHPACHSKVIAVGAVYDANVGARGPFPSAQCTDATTAADQIACYSESGNPLDILAPADCATTPKPGGGYDPCFNGTSAAAPYATGVAAQLLSLRPSTAPSALRTALMATGRPRPDVNGITRNRIDAVAAFQALGGGGNTGPCIRDADTACLVNNRFEVEVDWQTSTGSGDGQVMSFVGQRAENNDSAFFWFFSQTNFEMGLKILDACSFNNKFWVFISGLTDQGWTVHIRDTQTGATKTYTNAVGHLTSTTADTTVGLSCP